MQCLAHETCYNLVLLICYAECEYLVWLYYTVSEFKLNISIVPICAFVTNYIICSKMLK